MCLMAQAKNTLPTVATAGDPLDPLETGVIDFANFSMWIISFINTQYLIAWYNMRNVNIIYFIFIHRE